MTATRVTLPCSGSLLPLLDLEVGQTLTCSFCHSTVKVVPPPASSYGDPWPARTDPRVELHELVWEPPEPGQP